ncbi:hypothetical protein C4K22_2208 [Pseudomonas chlororaphis subsp. aurantiaca]|jgi:hypothetical protein|uniref:Uncharacterized protein n=1 Tax=Pseudomonas chlororaphis subsp. aurantiaca TaxID=86192 RepID=A0AAJ1E8F5_9PSED|nr:hypothetical protein [Pseudomonas chlororaphis]AZD21387.1 hypothetical protein C4K24_2083 [Pseudomonas chlororaphis subsp. aurantiaca]AZD34952.1 hypothetical protein C4K22_2208 [Pseudomonas chlororaphis subsp. aurantiaca]AZD41287.1 hypothetical protein C4K21_2212 [Pseudomonas chlororaphis subsp. aurantiaca]AZD47522.1 hypothetical protein C4K20_2106 [Pseudomonas chlororaphis subsp. aurantiaca]AZD65961.1 hypothetical protein C4K17_2074 [Pseudomonas chlororaphis subsp. aurantiaca]
MSISVGFPAAGAITINGKSPATIDALSQDAADNAAQALGLDEDGKLRVASGAEAEKAETQESEGDNQSLVVKMLLKRMKELQAQLQEQQQQLAAAQAASYPTPEAKATVVMAIQGQIADTSGALQEVVGNLVKELSKDSSSGAGGLVSTTA